MVPEPAYVEERHGRERDVLGRQVQDILDCGTAVEQHTAVRELSSLGASCSAAGIDNARGTVGIEIFIQRCRKTFADQFLVA